MSIDIPVEPLDSMVNKPPKVYFVGLADKLISNQDTFEDVIRWI